MKIKTFIFIFLIFTQNFIVIIKSCEAISIDRRDYKLYLFKEGLDSIPEEPIGNKKIFAFNYNVFYNYKNYIKSNIYVKVESIVNQEKRKVTPGLFHYLLDKVLSDGDESKFNEASQQIRTFDDVEINKRLDDYKTTKGYYSSALSIGQKTVQNSAIGGTIAFSLKKMVSIVAGKLLGKSELILSNPYTVGITFGVFFIIELGSKIYNWRLDCGIQKDKNEIYKLTGLYFSIQDQIKQLRWIGNNMVLTAKSTDETCADFAFKFDYYDGIKYRNPIEIQKYMENLTCVFRGDKCNYKTCRKNLEKYIKCIKKQER